MIDVAAAILENQNGEILIARRKQGKKLANYWEFPGGKNRKQRNTATMSYPGTSRRNEPYH